MSERFGRVVHDNRARWVQEVSGRWAVLSNEPWFGGEPIGEFASGEHFLAPVSPGKIVCVGRNYAAHAAELGLVIGELTNAVASRRRRCGAGAGPRAASALGGPRRAW